MQKMQTHVVMTYMIKNIISELEDFFNLPYFFEFDGKAHFVILGDKSCKLKDSYNKQDVQTLDSIQREIIKLYEKNNLTREEKIALALKFDEIIRHCEYKIFSVSTLEKQEEYLKQFNNNALSQIYEQIEMYKTAFRYYQEFFT